MADFKISLNLVANERGALASIRATTAALREYNREASRGRQGGAFAPRADSPLMPGRGRQGRATPFGIDSTEMNALASNFEAMGRRAGQALKMPLALAMDFEATMNKVDAMSGGKFGISGDLEKISARARELGRATEFTASQAGEAFATLSQAGQSYAQQMDTVPHVLDMATVAGISMQQAAQLTVDTLGQFNLEASQAERVASVMTRASLSSQISIVDLGNAFKYAGPAANAFGSDIESAATMMAVLGKSGVKGSMGGTTGRAFINRLTAASDSRFATKPQLGALEALGIDQKALKAAVDTGSPDQLAAFWAASVGKAIKSGKSRGTIVAAMQKLFQERGSTGGFIIAQSFLNDWERISAGIRDTSTTVHDMAEIKRSGAKAEITKLKSALEDLGIEVGNKLLPVLKPLIQDAMNLTAAFFKWSQSNGPTIVSLGKLAATLAIAGPLLGGFVRVAQTAVILSKLAGWQGAWAASIATTGTNAGVAAGKLTLMNKAHGILGGFITGYAIGTLADQWLGVSNAISGANQALSVMQGMTAGFSKRQEKSAMLGDLTEEERAELANQTAIRDKHSQGAASMENLGYSSDSVFVKGEKEKAVAAQNRINALNAKGNERATSRAAQEKNGKILSDALKLAMSHINRDTLEAIDAHKRNKGEKDTGAQLRVLVKVDEERRFVSATVDKMTLDAGMISEGV